MRAKFPFVIGVQVGTVPFDGHSNRTGKDTHTYVRIPIANGNYFKIYILQLENPKTVMYIYEVRSKQKVS